jgi:hypothetical protein
MGISLGKNAHDVPRNRPVIDRTEPATQSAAMTKKKIAIYWTGWGRWLGLTLSALLCLHIIALVTAASTMAGWNVFLGLLLAAAILLHHPKAAYLSQLLAVLLAVRLVLALAFSLPLVDVAAAAGLLALAAATAYDLRKQVQARRAANPPARP